MSLAPHVGSWVVGSAQVSVWVPIAVALLGIVGLVVDRLIVTHREQRREDVRWKRERLGIYADYVALMMEILEVIDGQILTPYRQGEPIDPDAFRRMDEFVDRMATQESMLLLISSRELAEAAGDLAESYGVVVGYVHEVRAVDAAGAVNDPEVHVDELRERFFSFRDKVRAEFDQKPLS